VLESAEGAVPGESVASGESALGAWRVLAIAGSGRSGSTIVELVLAQHDKVVATGELVWLWDRGLVENQLCGCGTPLQQCPFWTAVLETAYGSVGAAPVAEVLRLRTLVQRRRQVPDHLEWLHRPSFQDALARYRAILQPLYAAVAQCSGKDLVVDSSKLPYYLFVLAGTPDVDLRVLHLLRDARATCFSWSQTKARPEIHWSQESMPRFGLLAACGMWMTDNAGSELLGRRSPRAVIRYEDLAAEPRPALAAIGELAGLELDPAELLHRAAEASRPRVAHTVSGNPVRFGQGPLVIRPDLRWQAQLSRPARTLATLVTWPMLRRYGYLGGPGGPATPR